MEEGDNREGRVLGRGVTGSGMRVRVRVFGREVRELEVRRGTRVEDVLEALGLNPEEVLVLLDGQLVTEDKLLPEDAELEVVSVVSGG